ncbi:dicarboxylate/amino acid:cation symporter [Aerococcus urinaeequi]|uniref:dicarboxylate/amino acid:cation symporter n=1 Tax=Aerococcus urinaeequi TaxID=51665 RepID=UPI0022E46A70|nr:dicarboxylate/amino acid:cation symporter [Aerococcus urinaeequi]
MEKEKKGLSMTTQIVIALVLGIAFGYFFKDYVGYIDFLGQIFLRLIQMGIVFLILGQIVEAIGSLEIKQLGTIGLRTIIIFMISSLLASAWGVLFGLIFKPGSGISDTVSTSVDIEATQTPFSEVIINFFPQNIVDAMANGAIVQIISFAIFFGIALSIRASVSEPKFLPVLVDFNTIILQMIRLVMGFAPIGIFALIASAIAEYGIALILPLVSYLLVYSGATLLFLLAWLLIVSLYLRVSIIALVKKMSRMSIIALATTSSAITLPTAIEDSEERLGIKREVSRLVLPLGMSLNSNGSAMFMSITIITVAQIYGVQYGLTNYVFIIFLATLASLANAVVPGGGLVSLSIVIPQMGLPIESIAIFAAVEWFTGMIRTILNVNSDVFSGLIVAKSVDAIDREKLNSTHI